MNTPNIPAYRTCDHGLNDRDRNRLIVLLHVFCYRTAVCYDEVLLYCALYVYVYFIFIHQVPALVTSQSSCPSPAVLLNTLTTGTQRVDAETYLNAWRLLAPCRRLDRQLLSAEITDADAVLISTNFNISFDTHISNDQGDTVMAVWPRFYVKYSALAITATEDLRLRYACFVFQLRKALVILHLCRRHKVLTTQQEPRTLSCCCVHFFIIKLENYLESSSCICNQRLSYYNVVI